MITKGERGAVINERGDCGVLRRLGFKPWGQSADGDNSLKLSVGVEKVQTKNGRMGVKQSFSWEAGFPQ